MRTAGSGRLDLQVLRARLVAPVSNARRAGSTLSTWSAADMCEALERWWQPRRQPAIVAVKMINYDILIVCSINHTATKKYLATAKRVGIRAKSCYALFSTLMAGWASGNVGQKD